MKKIYGLLLGVALMALAGCSDTTSSSASPASVSPAAPTGTEIAVQKPQQPASTVEPATEQITEQPAAQAETSVTPSQPEPQPIIAPAANASKFVEGRHFEVVTQGPGTSEPEIMEFFSFACPHCRSFEPLVESMLKQKPEDIAFRHSHVDFVGRPIGEDLTRAWAVAEILQIEEQVKPILFQAVQDDGSVRSADDIRRLFVAAGVSEADYDNAFNSFMVNGRVAQMQKNTQRFGIRGVPSFVVNGKYRVITKYLSSAEELNELLFYLARK